MKPVQRDRLSLVQFSAEPARYESMPYRRCGASGLRLPVISLGAWETFGGYRGPEISQECIFRAFNLMEQVEENVRALENLKFSEDELRQIDAILKA